MLRSRSIVLPLALGSLLLSCDDGGLPLAGPSDSGPLPDVGEINNGCPALREPIDEDLEGDTYATWAGPMFFERFCTRCHGSTLVDDARNGAPMGYDWDVEATLRGDCGTRRVDGGREPVPCLERIRHAAGVLNYMPFMPGPGDPVPTCQERRRLVRWIDGGAP